MPFCVALLGDWSRDLLFFGFLRLQSPRLGPVHVAGFLLRHPMAKDRKGEGRLSLESDHTPTILLTLIHSPESSLDTALKTHPKHG